MNYQSFQDATKALLVEAVNVVRTTSTVFAVCGGWSSVLRNTATYKHPGTRDVDILFENGETEHSLRGVIQALLNAGYVLSAKHHFQLLRVLNVGDQRFVFNVDLLHPREGSMDASMFVDHFSVPVLGSDFENAEFKVKSMVLPFAAFVFDGFTADETVEAVLPSGKIAKATVPVIDEVALLATKSKSCHVDKRPRDIFDIFLAISSPRDANVFEQQLRRLRDKHKLTFDMLQSVGKALPRLDNDADVRSFFANAGIDPRHASNVIEDFLKTHNEGGSL